MCFIHGSDLGNPTDNLENIITLEWAAMSLPSRRKTNHVKAGSLFYHTSICTAFHFGYFHSLYVFLNWHGVPLPGLLGNICSL